MDNNDEIDLLRIIYLITKHKKRIFSLAIIGMLLGSVVTGLMYLKNERLPRHVITCSFAVVATNSSGAYGSNSQTPGYNDVKLAEDIAESVIFVAKSDRVLNTAIEQKHFLGINNDDIRKYMDVEQYGDTQIVTLKLRWLNANEGLSIVQAICDVTPDILIETLNLGSVSVVDYPKDAGIEAPQIKLIYIPVFTVLFAGLYVCMLFLQNIIHPTLTDISSIEKDLNGLDVLGTIPDNGKYFSERPFSLEEKIDDSYEVIESFVSASYIIKNMVEREGHKCFYITSSEAGEGKTGVVANLAIQLSKREHKILVVDMDIKRPSLGSCFFKEVDHLHSLNAVYDGTANLEDAIISVSDNLDVLATRLEKNSIRIDHIIKEDLKKLFEKYDIVLLDAPPIGVVSDTASLNSLADRAIMVVKFDKVWLETIKNNIEKLKSTGIETCGVIVTNVNHHPGSGYHSYYSYNSYYNYYNREKPKKEKTKKEIHIFNKKQKEKKADD